MKKQTCNRHPEAGKFIATCSGCTQELYNIEQANRALAAEAHAALASIGAIPGTRVLSITRIRTTMVISTANPNPRAAFPYAVDSFRLPTTEESDPDQVDPYPAGEWILVDQIGNHSRSDVDDMLRNAFGYLADLGLVTDLDLMDLAA
ncbi:hypothetical protein [Streptomyces sp. NPDC047985]|uniref:hypothetical protein n=1 Tax=Streptomyces sp. NPDC047985 TaxID=3155384 RepID=UPI00341E59D9